MKITRSDVGKTVTLQTSEWKEGGYTGNWIDMYGEYEISGVDHMGRVWLSHKEPDYDGYDADLIVSPELGEDGHRDVHLSDERSSTGGTVRVK